MGKESRLLAICSLASVLALFDNSIKKKIEDGTINNGVIEKTNGFAEIEKHHNKGIPLNKFDNHTREITLISSIVLIVHAMRTGYQAMQNEDGIYDIANTLILGGAMSNTYDRISKGYVVDYLKIGKKRAIYNISDFLIIGGVTITIIKSFMDFFKPEKKIE